MPQTVETVALNKEQNAEFFNVEREVEVLKKSLTDKKAYLWRLEEKSLQTKIQIQIAESYKQKDPEVLWYGCSQLLSNNNANYQCSKLTLFIFVSITVFF